MKKFLKFEKTREGYRVVNKRGEYLGYMEKCSRWNQWVFVPDGGTQFTAGCLKQAVDKLKELDGTDFKQSG